MMDKAYTAAGSPNIALVKYWGKRKGSTKNLPNNSSLSITLGGMGALLLTVTSVLFSRRFLHDRFYINGRCLDAPKGAETVLGILRRRARTGAKALVVSYNSFAESAGIASSASGSATLAFAASRALGLRMSGKELSMVAREGSGSAARSVFGGIVEWRRGRMHTGSDSYAVQVVPPSYWPDLVDIICIISVAKKKVSSTEGHSRTVMTSALYAARPAYAERNVRLAIKAIRKKNFGLLSEIIMRDSDSMHAVMLDSWPPMRYITDKSWDVAELVQDLNRSRRRCLAAYTFDAGQNVHVITTRRDAMRVKRELMRLGIDKVIESGIGNGPVLLGDDSNLIDDTGTKPRFSKLPERVFAHAADARRML